LPPALVTPFDVSCHVGTLAAVVLFFRADLLNMLRALPGAVRAATPDGADLIKTYLQTPTVAATALIGGAALLFAIERMVSPRKDEASLGVGGAFLIGAAQAAALMPGVSRSGATIVTGMALGLRREVAARFAFLMSIPAIVAAAAKEALELRGVPMGADAAAFFAVGTISSAVVGYVTVKYFVRYLATHRLDVFAWYRIVLGSALLVWLIAR
jgi:undecaprenyl-diphosphatase